VYQAAEHPGDDECDWNGSEGVAPFRDAHLEWEDCENPFSAD